MINPQQAAQSRVTCWLDSYGIKSNEFHDAFPVKRRWSADILFPLFDGGIRNAKIQELRKLRHGQGKVDPFLAEVLTECLGMGWIAPQLSEMKGNR